MITPNQQDQDRQIRVFISSTFRDMHAERDHLVKFIFPELRRLCESRGVTWGEVDLRWGVTDEQAAEGKVLPICLEEIRRCRPYFIGMLGERYGWVPDSIPWELLKREAWLMEQLAGHKSVTELEILHGVLNDPKMAGHAFFYFRDPKYLDKLPPDAKREDFTTEDAESAEKLRELKRQIKASGFPARENFSSPKALGELVLADLTAVINQLYPEGSQPSELERERMDHEAYARSRAQVYIGREDYFQKLDTHASGCGDHPLVITGESGGGKSALLANWTLRYRKEHSDALVIQHYIGGTPLSAEWMAMLRRVMGEFKERLGVEAEIPSDPQKLREEFPVWLHRAAAKGRVVLILDALNQLEDRNGAPDLVWLPPVMPENVRVILSTLPGRPLQEIRRRQWPEMTVQPLTVEERKLLIDKYLAERAKKLSDARSRKIAAAPQSANPLYLRVLLDELCVAAGHEEHEKKLDSYLTAATPAELYGKVIARWEADYGGGTDLVGDALSLLWAERRGLSETELLEALGDENGPLPRAVWSPLFLAMARALVSRGGLLSFAHDFLRSAAQDAYVPTEASQQKAHLRLAEFFERQPTNLRRIDELPWQLAAAKAWQRLQALLTDRLFFTAAWERNQFEVKAYWAQIEGGSSFRMVEAYQALIESPDAEPDKGLLTRLSMFLADTGHPEEALCLRATLVDHFRFTGDFGNLEAALGNQALILYVRGDLDGAMALYKEQERICLQLGKLDSLSHSLGNQAAILKDRGDLDGAMALLNVQERIGRQLGNLDVLQATMGSKALILQALGDLDGAMALFKEAERINRQLGNLDSLSYSLGNQATILHARGDLDEAMALFKEAERIGRQLGNLDSLSHSLGNQALILQDREDLDGAMALLKEAERIGRQLGNLDVLQCTLGNQATILHVRGDLDGAMALHKKTGRICQQLGNVEGLARSLVNQVSVLMQQGRAYEGLPLGEEALRLATRNGYAALARQIEPFLNTVRRAAQRGSLDHVSSTISKPQDASVDALRASAAESLKKGYWEAAQTVLEKLLKAGDSPETIIPDLITAILNAQEEVPPYSKARVETLLAQLEQSGHAPLAAQLRQQHAAKLAPPEAKKQWWKLW